MIGVVAPASAFPREAFDQGVALLASRGFEVRYLPDIFERLHYYAGSVERRVQELELMLADENVKALFSTRGGYGSLPVLAGLHWQNMVARPRILLGCSDLTPMLNWVAHTLSIVSFHGPMVAGFHKTRPESLDRLFQMLGEPDVIPAPMVAPEPVTLRPGVVTAPLCGGNVCTLASALGTPWAIEARGKILCLEEIGERPYRLDRLLTQLSFAGKLEGIAGLAIGGLTDCEEPGGRGRNPVDVVWQVAEGLGVPVLAGLPFGHGAFNHPLPLGAVATLDAAAGTLSFESPVVS